MGGSGRPPDHAHVVTGIPAKSVGLPEASQVGGEAHADWQPPTPETRGGVDFTSYLQVHPHLKTAAQLQAVSSPAFGFLVSIPTDTLIFSV